MARGKKHLSWRAKLAAAGIGGALALIGGVTWYLIGKNFAVLNPAGTIADSERKLMFTALLLSVIVVVPVFTLLFYIAWRYREGNTKALYQPNRDGSRVLEIVWWLIPGALIVTLSIITWVSTHQLDPYRPIATDQTTLRVQVIALDWKWLFLYPDQHVASVNTLQLPTGRPVRFEITADAPMNSFWIPQLGGQVYAMPGMTTLLNLQADKAGNYRGSSANLSGKGFAGMVFTAHAGSENDLNAWVKQAQTGQPLDQAAYDQLAQPSENVKPAVYKLTDPTLFNAVISKYMDQPTGAAS